MHDTLVFADSSGNCAGSVQQRLGGIASVAGAFIVGWTSAEGRMSADPAVARVADDRSVAAPTWLSDAAGDDRELHVGSYASGAVALWIGADGAGRAVRIAASSALDGAAEPIDAAAIDGASDIVRLSDGDTAWIVGGRLARLRACE